MKTDELGSGDRTDVGSGTLVLAIGLFAVIASLIGFDILADYRSGTEPPHLVTEGIVMALDFPTAETIVLVLLNPLKIGGNHLKLQAGASGVYNEDVHTQHSLNGYAAPR